MTDHYDITLDIGFEWSPKQWEVLTFRAPPNDDGSPQIEQVGVLGDFGGGKTTVCAARALSVALENPFIDGLHSSDAHPMSVFVAETLGELKTTSLVEFRKICPDDLIYQERMYGEYQDLTLINGHRIVCRGARAATKGQTVCQVWCDEIQERIYADVWDVLHARTRDPNASWLNIQASGIAQLGGHVEQIFRHPDNSKGNKLTALLYPEDNEDNLAAGYVDELRSTLPASRVRDTDGWMSAKGAMYPKFSTTHNMCLKPDLADLYDNPTHLGVDLGTHAAVVFGQDTPVSCRIGKKGARDEAGLLIVDQWLPDNRDANEIAQAIKREFPWAVDHRSEICLDPTLESLQVDAFRRAFPKARLVQHKTGPYRKELTGIEAVDRAVLDGHKNARLFVHPDLVRDETGRGVVAMFRNYLERKPKDKQYEHVADAVRYLVQHRLPLPSRKQSLEEANSKEMQQKLAKVIRRHSITTGVSETWF